MATCKLLHQCTCMHAWTRTLHEVNLTQKTNGNAISVCRLTKHMTQFDEEIVQLIPFKLLPLGLVYRPRGLLLDLLFTRDRPAQG
jgi:hypothetical protein